MKNVLVLIHDDAGQEARFQAALDLRRALNGHLVCVDVAMMPLLAFDYEGSGTALLLSEERSRERANRARLEQRLKAASVPYNWIDECGFLSPCMQEAAATADLIVLNRELDQIKYPDMLGVVGDLIVKARKPIVAVPANARGFDAGGRALVAWDGSKEAEASVRAAVPLLACAATVTLLEIDDGSIKNPAEKAARYLATYGIRATISRETAVTTLPSAIILDKVKAIAASYLVMGGFGHRRFIEAAFGGVTRRMLKSCPVPIFLVH